MALSALDDKSKTPDQRSLRSVLGKSAVPWQDIIAHIRSEYTGVTEKWNFPGGRYGWSLRLMQGKRIILHMTPCNGHFLAGFVHGQRGVQAAHDRRLPGPVLAAIDSASQYTEGRGFRLEVRTKSDAGSIKKLAAIKVETSVNK